MLASSKTLITMGRPTHNTMTMIQKPINQAAAAAVEPTSVFWLSHKFVSKEPYLNGSETLSRVAVLRVDSFKRVFKKSEMLKNTGIVLRINFYVL